MQGRDASGFIALALLGLAAGSHSAAAGAADAAGYVPRFSGAQLMIYVSRPLGMRGHGINTYGLRYERASPGSSDPAARFCAPLRHRSLIDLQLVRGAAPRMQFGPKVTWDLGRGQLEPTGLARSLWSMRPAPVAGDTLAAWVP